MRVSGHLLRIPGNVGIHFEVYFGKSLGPHHAKKEQPKQAGAILESGRAVEEQLKAGPEPSAALQLLTF